MLSIKIISLNRGRSKWKKKVVKLHKHSLCIRCMYSTCKFDVKNPQKYSCLKKSMKTPIIVTCTLEVDLSLIHLTYFFCKALLSIPPLQLTFYSASHPVSDSLPNNLPNTIFPARSLQSMSLSRDAFPNRHM